MTLGVVTAAGRRRALLQGSGVNVPTTVTYQQGSDAGAATQLASSLQGGAPWLAGAYPGSSVSNVTQGGQPAPPAPPT